MASDFIIPVPTNHLKRPRQNSPLLPELDSTGVALMYRQIHEGIQNTAALGRLVQQLNDRIARCERRGSVEVPDATVPFFPFKVYEADLTQFQGATGQGITFDLVGNQININIDSTKPTDFTATPPTVNPITDAWRFYNVRGGYVQVRPYYSVIVNDQLNNNFGYVKDYTSLFLVEDGTDGINPDGLPTVSDGFEWDDPTTTAQYQANGTTIVIPDINGSVLDVDSNILFAVWLDIMPDTADGLEYIRVQVNGRRFTLDVFNNYPFPEESPLCIPLAIIKNGTANFVVGANPTFPLIVDQVQSGHVINRYLPGMFVVGGGIPPAHGNGQIIPGAIIYRGDWDNDNIQDQVFYPGDFVKQTIVVNAQNVQALFLWCPSGMNPPPIGFTTDPSTDSNFIQILP